MQMQVQIAREPRGVWAEKVDCGVNIYLMVWASARAAISLAKANHPTQPEASAPLSSPPGKQANVNSRQGGPLLWAYERHQAMVGAPV